ncbi:MAG: NAD(P)-dependent oxidoreductase, partial [Acidimicrobiales bacterium]
MNILILGANGGTGVHVVEQAVAAGDRVIALVRDTNVNVGLTRDGVDLIHGDARSATDLAKAMVGADVVISTLGGRGPSIMSDAVRAIIDGAHHAGMRRVVVMSSFAVERDRLGPVTKLMSNLTMSKAIADKTASERLLRSSDLEWTIVYATVLTNKP